MMKNQYYYNNRKIQSGWRKYQADLKKKTFIQGLLRRGFYSSGTVILILGIMISVISGKTGWALFNQEKIVQPKIVNKEPEKKLKKVNAKPDRLMSKNDVQDLLRQKSLLNLAENNFDVFSEGNRYQVFTTIQKPLQQFIVNHLDTSSSRYIGVVVMDPYRGRILSMVGYDRTNHQNNTCLDNSFPAASVFKIVTAAAAIETCGFDSDSTIDYNGGKYTLYKSQINKNSKRQTNEISLQDSFAQSVNPVFGKLGAMYLSRDVLEDYAKAFGFNRNIRFEIPFQPSMVSMSDEPYRMAEIASGYNRETTISPLHGALMASIIQNQGRLIEPMIVDHIINDDGHVVYRSRMNILNQAVSPKSARVMKELMEATISSGTCKRFFKNHEKHEILSKINIGGKTGTISSREYPAKFDWFVGFAEEKNGQEKIVLAVVTAHEKFIGTRSGQFARMIVEEYFQTYFNQ